jgi:hypothetical protein
MKKSRSQSSEKLAKQTYEEFLRSVRLVAVGLRDCRCSIDRDRYRQIAAPREGLTRINSDYKLEKVAENFFDTLGILTVTIEDQKAKREAVSIACTFESHFHADFAAGSDFPERFANGEFRLILWPYFRELVSSLTQRMWIRTIVLPLSSDT